MNQKIYILEEKITFLMENDPGVLEGADG